MQSLEAKGCGKLADKETAVRDISRGRDGARLSQLGARRRTADQRQRAVPNGAARKSTSTDHSRLRTTILPRKLRNKTSAKTISAVKKLRNSLTAHRAAKKSSARSPKKNAASSKTRSRKKPTGFHGGSYVTPKGNVSIGIPAFWTLRQTNDDLEVESPSRKTSVIVTAFQRENGVARLDARQYLEHFLQSASMKGRPDGGESGPSRAQSRFRDPEGDHWQIEVLTNGDTLLLATLNSSLPPRSQEPRVGAEILRTIRLNGK
jgi:hypothetical protein